MGRPAYRPGSEDRRKVQVLKAAGWPERSLARLLGICRETLRKAFAEEPCSTKRTRRTAPRLGRPTRIVPMARWRQAKRRLRRHSASR